MRKKIVRASVLMLVFSIALGINPFPRVKAVLPLDIYSDYTFTANVYQPIVVKADDIVIDGDGYSLIRLGSGNYGFHLYGRTNVTIKNVEIKNWERGINLESSSGNNISGNKITKNIHGIRLGSSSGNNLCGNNISANSANGVILDDSSGNIISGNNITYTGSFYGLAIRSSSSNIISGNNISANMWGVVLDYSSGNSYSGNDIYANINTGVVIRLDSSDNSFSGNNISSNSVGVNLLIASSGNIVSGNNVTLNNCGIVVDGTPDTSIIENNIIANGLGLWIKYTSNNIVSGNNITENTGQGINIGYSSGDGISENYIENNQYGIWIHHSSGQSISRNNITENTWDGVWLQDSSDISVFENNITQNTRHGVYLVSSSSTSISSNNITKNKQFGVYLKVSLGNSFFGNEIIENKYYGIRIESSQNNVIYHNNIVLNTLQVYDDFPADNYWHHPGLLEGNYWSDYPGVDDGSGTGKHAVAGDGIGDTDIPWPGTYFDDYPFVHEGGWMDNTPPIINIVTPVEYGIYPYDSGETYQFSAVDNVDPDPDVSATLTDFLGQAISVLSGELLPSSSGVYTLTIIATDYHGNTAVEEVEFVVYDSTAGFVTGGGWIDSPEGAYKPDPTLTGKARFIFVAKYVKGASEPDGQTEFVFQVADLNFRSTYYQWLVISGSKAQFKGYGTINGEGEYGFMLTVIDGQLKNDGTSDKFRIKIWDISTDVVVYDNHVDVLEDSADPTTEIMYGNIVIHKGIE